MRNNKCEIVALCWSTDNTMMQAIENTPHMNKRSRSGPTLKRERKKERKKELMDG